MALQSKLFSGDPLLESAAMRDQAHITPGARGPHIGKIQQALALVDGAAIDQDQSYGPATASAVLAYKKKRGIINFSYQTQPDDIVGKMTIASLDAELLERERIPTGPLIVRPVHPGARPPNVADSALFRAPAGNRLAVGGPTVGATASLDLNLTGFQKIRVPPRFTATVEILNGAGGRVVGRNSIPPSDTNAKISWAFDPDDKLLPVIRLNPEPIGPATAMTDAGFVRITKSPFQLKIDSYKPGDGLFDFSAENGLSNLHVEVRAPKMTGPSGPAPITVNPRGKNGLISGNGDPGVPGGVSGGRPMKIVGSRRKINLGGEHETPGFEDYTASLGFSACPDFPDRNHRAFRPWTEDRDPSVFVSDGEASDICIRNTPVTDEILAVIKRIKASPCRLTFSGRPDAFTTLKGAFSGEASIADEIIDEAIVLDFP
ncbi:hypothetical protein [Methylocella silvestris]|uniref:Peptidoglycan binding-like domain-containing protein n=1 Tax=Methylocella silvestris TaxID=199596 RepID=A0A2J7TEN3_METSI|nr:hypothetical protein [Methylocella silvestris]PNG25235.1 hypothetical protein CR492_14790 [Methylocella silvestris]